MDRGARLLRGRGHVAGHLRDGGAVPGHQVYRRRVESKAHVRWSDHVSSLKFDLTTGTKDKESWSALRQDSTGEDCENAGCSNKLVWQRTASDSSVFVFDASNG